MFTLSETIVDKQGESDYASNRYADRVTPLGMIAVVALLFSFAVLYLLSYPLADISRGTMFSVVLGSTESFFYTVLGLLSVALIVRYRKNISTYEIVLAVMTATIVCIAIETRYWSNDWDLVHPNYDVYLSGMVTLLMVLGSLAMLKTERVLHVSLAEERFSEMVKGFLIGWGVGLPIAIISVVYFILIEKLPWAFQDILNCMVIAAGASVMEGVACRLLIMGLLLVVLRRYLPKAPTIAIAVLAGAFLVPAVCASGQLLAEPLEAGITMIVTGLLFGVPMALLAYYKDIEAAIGVHWIADVVKFSLGL